MSASRWIGAAALLALAIAAPDQGRGAPDELSRVASLLAKRPVEVRCPTADVWARDPAAIGLWSYANLRADYAALEPRLCAAALGVADRDIPTWQRAAGVLALVHESHHLRRWKYRRNEAKVTCVAIREFTLAVLLLDATPEVANELLPYALALHIRTVELFPLYAAPGCRLPVWRPPEGP
jgi:hypothetical protein